MSDELITALIIAIIVAFIWFVLEVDRQEKEKWRQKQYQSTEQVK